MIRIAISCGEGFSSGFLARHLEQEVKRLHMEEEMSVVFIPFYQLKDREDEVDIAMLMPHIEHKAKTTKETYHIPLYVIPYKVVVKPGIRDFLEDAQDILAMAHGRGGLFAFEEEERTQNVSRLVSHRKWLEERNSL